MLPLFRCFIPVRFQRGLFRLFNDSGPEIKIINKFQEGYPGNYQIHYKKLWTDTVKYIALFLSSHDSKIYHDRYFIFYI
jgi:hypothetical protein